ncbi:hypothetical protein KUTeg_011596 [Tegillarca granosa]|uniref:HECT domain-containing protein n=1 Tax=Tegillarca granosa TaxID=220873 RepID=A0ABQ9F0K7_TEGGR|nr:hypothetical protein KUTeg_011596 [Tegillarca granosa]
MGIPSLFENFVKEYIDAKMVESLSDEELSRLGVSTIGQRHKLNNCLKRKPRGTITGSRNSSSKRRKSVASVTMQFICLASKSQKFIPNSAEKEILNKAGLGKKKNRFNKTDTEKDVFEKLMSNEKNELGEGLGGIELLRITQNCRELKLIDCSSWSAKELQNNVNPQSSIYIRPIQNDLALAPEQSGDQTNDDSLLQKCNGCQKEFRLKELRKHTENCSDVHNTSDIIEDAQVLEKNDENLSFSGNNVVFSEPENLETIVVLEPVPVIAGPVFGINSNETKDDEIDLQDVSYENIDDQSIEQPIAEGVAEIVDKIVNFCKSNNIVDPVEILRKSQMELVRGRALEISDNAVDYGGPRKEFFCAILAKIKEKYFDHGIRQLLSEDYEVVGKVFALSILQNGKIPTFLGPDILQKLFSKDEQDECIMMLRKGLNSLGIYTISTELPSFVYLFQSSVTSLTFRMLTAMLKPLFSPDGSNNNMLEKKVYSAFLRYLREVASGRRENISVGKILQFVTGAEEEPVVGFTMKPTIQFVEKDDSFIPTANTCINCLRLPRPSSTILLPEDLELFRMYDYAFANSYYGLKTSKSNVKIMF